MKTTLKSTLAALGVAILTALAITSCKTTGNNSSDTGMHTMGSQKTGYTMPDSAMPAR